MPSSIRPACWHISSEEIGLRLCGMVEEAPRPITKTVHGWHRKELRRQPRHQRDYRPSLQRSFRNGSDQLANDSATNRSCYSVA
jgi:hypothetical protein